VLCAKPDEQRIVEKVLDKGFEQWKIRGEYLPAYKIKTAEGVEESLIVANCGGMGNIHAASKTGFMLGTYSPNLILFVGTAGSLIPAKCCLGDVIVPEKGAVSLLYDKIVDEDDTENFKKWRSRKTTADLWPRDIADHEYALRIVKDKTEVPLNEKSLQYISVSRKARGPADLTLLLNKISSDKIPEIHYDKQIFSWEKIIATSKYRDRVQSEYPSAYAVDMESYGFLLASKQYQETGWPVRAIVVRGISDLCDITKSTSFAQGNNDLAVENATIIAAEIIKRAYLTI
jgi:nucleoside phosphorylase